MSQTEYIAGFYGVLIGFTLTELISGVAETLKNLGKVKYYPPHGLFVMLTFFVVILNFFDFYYFLGSVKHWTPILLIQNCFPAIFLCFFAYMLFPQFNRESIDFREHYFKIAPIIFGLCVPMIILILLRNIFLQNIPPFFIANIILTLLLLICVIGIFSKRDWFHYLLLILANLLVVYFTLLFQLN